MRIAAAICFGLLAVGAASTWATDWAVAGAYGDAVGTVLMILGGGGWLSLTLYSARRNALARSSGVESSEQHDEPRVV